MQQLSAPTNFVNETKAVPYIPHKASDDTTDCSSCPDTTVLAPEETKTPPSFSRPLSMQFFDSSNKITICDGPTSSPEEAKPRTKSQSAPRKLSLHDFELLTLLGSGAYSKVALVERVDSRRRYAMKIVEKHLLEKERMEKNIRRERVIWSKLSHPGIVKLHYSFTDEKRLYFVMDYLPNGTLRELLLRQSVLPYEWAKHYIAEIVSVLDYLHSAKGIAHRDLKPENFLLDSNMHLKLSDFGSAIELEAGAVQEKAGTGVGTRDYAAPEVLMSNKSGVGADLWSLGCIAYELFAGKPPFKAEGSFSALSKIEKGSISFPDEFPELGKDLCLALLKIDEKCRLGYSGIDQIKAHPFFGGVDFGTIYSTLVPVHSELASDEQNYATVSEIKLLPEYFPATPQPSSRTVIKKGVLLRKIAWVYAEEIVLVTADGRLHCFDKQMNTKNVITLSKAKVKNQSGDMFVINVRGRRYEYKAGDAKKAEDWVKAIKEIVRKGEEEGWL